MGGRYNFDTPVPIAPWNTVTYQSENIEPFLDLVGQDSDLPVFYVEHPIYYQTSQMGLLGRGLHLYCLLISHDSLTDVLSYS